MNPIEMPGETYSFEPLTASRWCDLEDLFGPRGACGGCWCMSWRKRTADFRRDSGAKNRDDFQSLVLAGPPPGILAYSGKQAVGWCAVAPRQQYVTLARSRVLRPLDDELVWSVSCLYVRRQFRMKGLSVALLKAAVDFVKAAGGGIVEGYPVISRHGKLPAAFAWTGLLPAFLSAGFKEMPRWSEARPILRYYIERCEPGT